MSKRNELSEKEVVLLGLVAEEPTHAYRVEEKLRARRMEEWTELGFSSVYRTLAGLERQGLVQYRLEHEGQGPARKIHAVTRRGREALAAGVLAQLGALEPLKLPFQMGLAFVTHAPQAGVLARLGERAERIARARIDLVDLRRRHQGEEPESGKDERSRLAYRRWLSVRLLLDHVADHLEVEKKYVQRARRQVARASADIFARRG